MWRESAYGLDGLLVTAHLSEHGPIVVPRDISQWLGIDEKAAKRLLRRWSARGHFCVALHDNQFLLHQSGGDAGEAESLAGEDAVLAAKRQHDRHQQQRHLFKSGDTLVERSLRESPHYESGRAALAAYVYPGGEWDRRQAVHQED